MLKILQSSFLDILFPPRCPVCRTAVATHGIWCNTCFRAAWAPRSLHLATHGLEALDDCHVLCNYTAGVQRIIRDMKFRQARRYGCHISWLLRQASLDAVGPIDAIIPVPLSPERLATRGYNQTEVMFLQWAESKGLNWLEALVRQKTTLPQWELTLKERRANIKGAFEVTRQAELVGKHILLVDDIFTTGLTMEECAKVLKQAGALSVVGLAVASGAH